MLEDEKDKLEYMELNYRLVDYHAAMDFYLCRLFELTGVDITKAQMALSDFAKAMTEILLEVHPQIFGLNQAATEEEVTRFIEEMMIRAREKRQEEEK